MAKILAGVGAALTAVSTWAWTHTHKRIDGKADGEAFDKLSKKVDEHTISRDVFDEHAKSDDMRLQAISGEVATVRATQAKIFDQMRDMEKTSTLRHEDILKAIHSVAMDKHK